MKKKKRDLLQKMDRAILHCKEGLKSKPDDWFLNNTLKQLDMMKDSILQDTYDRQVAMGWVGGMGKVILDDWQIRESEFGDLLIEICNEYVKL